MGFISMLSRDSRGSSVRMVHREQLQDRVLIPLVDTHFDDFERVRVIGQVD